MQAKKRLMPQRQLDLITSGEGWQAGRRRGRAEVGRASGQAGQGNYMYLTPTSATTHGSLLAVMSAWQVAWPAILMCCNNSVGLTKLLCNVMRRAMW